MKILWAFLLMAGGLTAFQGGEREVLALERTSLDGWLKGDSGPALAVSDAGVTFFHVMTERRVDGVAGMKEVYANYGGRPLYDSYQMENPKVQLAGDVAVLSYVLITHNGDTVRRWNATQVYQRKTVGWRVIHSHFSATLATQ